MDEVRPVVVRAVANAFQHVEPHVRELGGETGEVLPHGPVDRGERVLLSPQDQHGDPDLRHQGYRTRAGRARHRRHERVQSTLGVSWPSYDLHIYFDKQHQPSVVTHK